jgi:hypothetical protein
MPGRCRIRSALINLFRSLDKHSELPKELAPVIGRAALTEEESMGNTDYPLTVRPLSKEDGGGWLVEYPDLPVCMSEGETIAGRAFSRDSPCGYRRSTSTRVPSGRVGPHVDALEPEFPSDHAAGTQALAIQGLLGVFGMPAAGSLAISRNCRTSKVPLPITRSYGGATV